ncbi:MAG TPA: serine/threonine-protein kinase [Gemmatimonadales bacterium]|jgi:serine/threonine-protein kinase
MTTALALHDSIDSDAQDERRSLERALAGRYRLVELISRGGMGSVWRGWESGLERSVAIKMLAANRALDADERGRFRREGRILASLSHRNIVSVHGLGESQDACWLALPYYPGGTLAARLQREPRIPLAEARTILIALADALATAHARGVIHRDIKAENILIDERREPVLADFGVAILKTSEASRAEIVKSYGTPAYMAPEQFRGDLACDGRLDVYALGVLGFRMLSGRFPFEGSDEQIAAAHLTKFVPPLEAHVAEVPKDVAHVIDRCLEREPRRRWAGAAELRDALKQTVSAAPRFWSRLGRGRRAHND